jgi:hypothetical protein
VEALTQAGKERQGPFIIFSNSCLVVTFIGPHEQVLAHRHVGKDAPRLWHRAKPQPDDLGCGQSGDRLAGKVDCALAGFDQPQDHFHRCALAAGIAAQQTDNFAGLYLQVHPKMHLQRSIKGIDVA